MTLLAVDTAAEPRNGTAATRMTLWEFVEQSQLQCLVIGASKDPNAKVTVLLVGADGQPQLALKAPTTRLAEAAVDAERRVLSELAALPPEEVLKTIPRPVDVVEFEGRRALAMTAVRGTPMTTPYMSGRHRRSRTRVAADLAAAADWLDSFRRATAATEAPLEMDGGVSERLRERFAGHDRLEENLERLAGVHARLRRETVPRTAVHGDFWMGNVLVADGRVTGVVDWEAAASSGEPARDLARFAHMYALYLGGRATPRPRVAGHAGLRGGRWGAALEYALEGTGWFPDLYRSFLGDGLARLGASSSAWRALALAGIAETAAFTDHEDFARLHLDLFHRCTRSTAGEGGSG